MTAKLNDELQKEIDAHAGQPFEVEHPGTHKLYYLVSSEKYEQLRPLFEADPMSTEEQASLIEQAGRRAGWDAPEMDDYDEYEKHHSQG